MEKKVEAILFDMDGTLIKYPNGQDDYWCSVLINASAEKNIKLEIDGKPTTQKIVEFLNKKYGGMSSIWACYDKHCYEKVKVSLERGNEISVYDDVIDVLESLSKEYKVGLITNHNKRGRDAIMKNCGIEKYFKIMLSPYEERRESREKPYPDMILHAMEILGTKNILYVGDTNTDIKTAENAKVPCVIVERDYAIDHPNKIKSLIEIKKILNELK